MSMTGFCQADLPTILTQLEKYINAPKPLSVHYNGTRENKVALAKTMAQTGLSLRMVDQISTSETFLLVLLQDHEIFDNIQMNQQVYFLTPSLDLFEKYIVNNQIIVQQLGHFVNDSYVPNTSADQKFFRRRQDFHGFKMVAMTEEEGTAIVVKNLENATYFPSNQTHDVTNSIQGSLFDIWKNLETMLNFTTKIYKRKENNNWGVPIQSPNGTIELSEGMVKDVWSGKAHVIMSATTMIYARYLVIDYLQPILTRDGGIFVKKEDLHEGFDLSVYWHPFADWTWILILSSSIIVTLCILFLWKVSNLTKTNAIKVLVRSLKVNLGTETDGLIPPKNQTTSLKFLFFTTLLMGNVIWLTYNGALLSDLITPKVVKPFHDLDTLIKSRYR